MKNVLKGKSGVTLVETLICMVLLAILSLMVIGALSPVMKMYVITNENAEANMLLGSISDEIVTNLSRAAAIEMEDDGISLVTSTDQFTYTVNNDGILCRKDKSAKNPSPVFDKNYYKGKDIVISYYNMQDQNLAVGAVKDPFYIEVKINSTKVGGLMATRKFAINPISNKVK